MRVKVLIISGLMVFLGSAAQAGCLGKENYTECRREEIRKDWVERRIKEQEARINDQERRIGEQERRIRENLERRIRERDLNDYLKD